MKTLLKDLGNHKKLFKDPKTGIAWVEDGSSGTGHSCHPNIHHSGSVRGMELKLNGDQKMEAIPTNELPTKSFARCIVEPRCDYGLEGYMRDELYAVDPVTSECGKLFFKLYMEFPKGYWHVADTCRAHVFKKYFRIVKHDEVTIPCHSLNTGL